MASPSRPLETIKIVGKSGRTLNVNKSDLAEWEKKGFVVYGTENKSRYRKTTIMEAKKEEIAVEKPFKKRRRKPKVEE